MDPDRHRRASELALRAHELAPAERERFLAVACGADAGLLREVDRLLAVAARTPESFLTPPPVGVGGVGDAPAAGPPEGGASGDRIGPYRIVSEIGRGGMGAVYLAARADGAFEQRVALKVLAGVVTSPAAVERFVAERRILAQLDHPGIARLLDGGSTPQGSPWFAMEHVEGEPIDAWCDRRRLTVRDRLQLFLAVCEPVAYAHRRLVVHRDLKPSNILIGADGSPKLLDFGIAKLLEPGGEAAVTRLGELPMTPEYASPEQVRGEPVTTATDVYQLGLLLYELLTGRPVHRLESHDRLEIERAVCGQEPPAPSSVVVTDAGGRGSERPRSAAEVAAARRRTPDRLRRRLRGDLDTIVLTALRREPERRYASVEQFAEDVRNHLEERPVAAHRDSFLYRARKLAVRRAGFLTAAALVVLALLAGLIGTTVQARRARQEARRAEEVTEFLTTLLQDADPDRSQGRDLTVRQVLDGAARGLEVELPNQPRLQATLQALVGRIYGQLGLHEESEAQLAAALERRRRLLGPDHPEVADTAERLAGARLQLGRTDDAERLARESLAIRRRSLGEDDPEVAGSLVTLARVRFEQGATDDGRALLERAFALLDDDSPESRGRLADALHAATQIELEAGELARAEELVRREVEIRRAAEPARTRGLALALDSLAGVLRIRGQPDQVAEAESALLEAIDIERALLGEGHPWIAGLLSNLAGVRARRGDFAGGEEAFQEALAETSRAVGPDHPSVAYLLNNIAVFYHRQGRWTEAIDYYRRSLDLRLKILGEDHPLVGTTRAYLGLALHMAGDPRTEATYRTALTELLASRGPEHEQVGNLRTDLGTLLAEKGRYAEAEPELRAALAILRPTFGDADQRTDSARAGLGFALCGLGRPNEGEPLLGASRAWREGKYEEGHWRQAEVGLYQAECLARRGRRAEANARVAEMLELLAEDAPQRPVLSRLGRRLTEEAGEPGSGVG